MLRASLIAAAVASLALLRPAAGFEGRVALGPEVAAGTVGAPFSRPGGGAAIHFAYGLSDAFDWTADAGWAAYSIAGETAHAGRLAVGLAYVIDVLQIVPSLSISAGALVVGRPSAPTLWAPVVEVAIAADYLLSRRWALGLAVRGDWIVTGDVDGQTMVLTFALRLLWQTLP